MTGLLWSGLPVIIIVGFLMNGRYGCCSTPAGTGYITGFIAGIILFFMLILWTPLWYSNKAFKAEYEATKETIKITREIENTALEKAALTHKIIEINRQLASKKYWNGGLLGWYIPDDVANLEPLR